MGVTPNMKVADVLKKHPELLDVLVAQSPHFARLRNPILRRIQGRMVTLAQAAAIGGVDPAGLVKTLNAALGEHEAEVGPVVVGSMAAIPPPPWLGSAKVVASVDVREAQQRKEEPFAAIMAGAAQVQQGEVLSLRNTFEPLPLYDVLAKRGFVAWARQLGPDDWEAFFFKAGEGANGHVKGEDTVPQVPVSPAASDEPAATLTVDVRQLVPPQPMMRILDALEKLAPGQTLLVHHVRRPAYLYPRLAELGCTAETTELGPDRVDVLIRKG